MSAPEPAPESARPLFSGSHHERPPKVKGPWFLRFLIVLFSVIFGLLVYWLLGFLLGDIGSWPGPS